MVSFVRMEQKTWIKSHFDASKKITKIKIIIHESENEIIQTAGVIECYLDEDESENLRAAEKI